MIIFRYFIMPLLGSIYASTWWAIAIFAIPRGYAGLMVFPIVIGVIYLILLISHATREIQVLKE